MKPNDPLLKPKRIDAWIRCMPYKNKEDAKIYIKKYRMNNKDKINTQLKEYRDSHKEERMISINIWYKKNKDKVNSQKRKLHAENSDILKEQYKKSKKSICIICGNSAREKYCCKKCMGIGMEADNNRFWNGGSKEGYPKTWTNRFKESIRMRDKHLCMECGKPQSDFQSSLDVHHIDGIKANTVKENCISLCTRCHAIIETRPLKERQQNIIRFYELLSKRYGYKYPTKQA